MQLSQNGLVAHAKKTELEQRRLQLGFWRLMSTAHDVLIRKWLQITHSDDAGAVVVTDAADVCIASVAAGVHVDVAAAVVTADIASVIV